ncbi:MAG: DUF1836 domain-containing protein [Clostridia bacterium]|nr:DUF1836 domain-containing protein [Clostridia bacterium]
MNKKEEIKNLHIPRWEEIPNIDLYIDQVVSLLENSLSNYIKNDNEKEDKIITKTMINNYVKHGVINPPINKKYNKEHIAYLFVIFILKQIYSMEEIKKLITLGLDTSPIDQAYNRFCAELEKAIKMTFSGDSYIKNDRLSQEQYILRNVVQSFANKLYVQKIYLKS